ncbi:MAG: SAM-dependent methyltransferase [Lachnospiraceae bacterium]
MDVGASTGGFTDCMLQNGAVKVYSCGCGPWPAGSEASKRSAGSLHGKTQHPLCDTEDIQEPVAFSSIDVSFISYCWYCSRGEESSDGGRRGGLPHQTSALRPAGESRKETGRRPAIRPFI